MEERFIKSPHTKLADANMLIKKEEKKKRNIENLEWIFENLHLRK